jgi:hypothetical protein
MIGGGLQGRAAVTLNSIDRATVAASVLYGLRVSLGGQQASWELAAMGLAVAGRATRPNPDPRAGSGHLDVCSRKSDAFGVVCSIRPENSGIFQPSSPEMLRFSPSATVRVEMASSPAPGLRGVNGSAGPGAVCSQAAGAVA